MKALAIHAISSSMSRPRALALAVVGFALQFFVVKELNDPFIAKTVLGLSHFCLIAVIILNRRNIGFLVVGLGLALNLTAIYANGGLMPIAPKAVVDMGLARANGTLAEGAKFGAKNVILDPADTRFYALSDRIPLTFPRPLLASIGDFVTLSGLAMIASGQLAGLLVRSKGNTSHRLTRRSRRGLITSYRHQWRQKLANYSSHWREEQFLREWQRHWLTLSWAIQQHLREGTARSRIAAEERFSRERIWLLRNRWKFSDSWVTYSSWHRRSRIGLWQPLDPRELLVCAPSDPYANVYEKGDIASIMARGQVRCGDDRRFVGEAFRLLDEELEHLIGTFAARGADATVVLKSKLPLKPHDAKDSL